MSSAAVPALYSFRQDSACSSRSCCFRLPTRALSIACSKKAVSQRDAEAAVRGLSAAHDVPMCSTFLQAVVGMMHVCN